MIRALKGRLGHYARPEVAEPSSFRFTVSNPLGGLELLRKSEVVADHLELRVPPEIAPTVLRALGLSTACDMEIDAMVLPNSGWRHRTVMLLRWYRHRIGRHLGSRCVYEPSCSHYAELAFRQLSFSWACWLTIRRLMRCRPGNGGLDLLPTLRKGGHL